jgi:hypothetical protein
MVQTTLTTSFQGERTVIDARLKAAVVVALLMGGCATPARPEFVKKFAVDQQACYDTGKLKYFGKDLTDLNKAECDHKINHMAKELERWYDPSYEEASKAMEANKERADRIMKAYSTVQRERVKAGEINEERAKALVQLKLEEVVAEMNRANREIVSDYQNSKSRGHSLTCMTTASSNLAFTTCN